MFKLGERVIYKDRLYLITGIYIDEAVLFEITEIDFNGQYIGNQKVVNQYSLRKER